MLWFVLGAVLGASLGVVALGICRFSARANESTDEDHVHRRRPRSARARRAGLHTRTPM